MIEDLVTYTDSNGKTCQNFQGKTYKLYIGNRYFTCWGMDMLHREVWKFYNGDIPEDHHIHHKDNDRTNNQLENLECIHKSNHAELHNKEKSSNNSHPFQREDVIEKVRERNREFHKSEAGAEQRKIATKGLIAWNNSEEGKKANKEMWDRQPIREYNCQECNTAFSTRATNPVKFCGNNCRNAAYRRNKKLKKHNYV